MKTQGNLIYAKMGNWGEVCVAKDVNTIGQELIWLCAVIKSKKHLTLLSNYQIRFPKVEKRFVDIAKSVVSIIRKTHNAYRTQATIQKMMEN